MGFRQSPFPMISGTTEHKKELASPAKISYPSSSQTGPHGPTGTKDVVGKYHYKKYLKEAGKKSKDPYFKDVMDKKTFQKSTTPTDVVKKQVPKQVVKQVAKKSLIKTGTKVLSRSIPVIGEALMTYDILKTGVKRIAKGIKTGVPQTKLTGKNIKNTFKRVPKKEYAKPINKKVKSNINKVKTITKKALKGFEKHGGTGKLPLKSKSSPVKGYKKKQAAWAATQDTSAKKLGGMKQTDTAVKRFGPAGSATHTVAPPPSIGLPPVDPAAPRTDMQK